MSKWLLGLSAVALALSSSGCDRIKKYLPDQKPKVAPKASTFPAETREFPTTYRHSVIGKQAKPLA
jgi:hypothetical protein